jgi:lysophosphatidylcholine acyltransferase / lyso-PAF acetyltransferase
LKMINYIEWYCCTSVWYYCNHVVILISFQGNLILSDLGLAEKRVYHAALNGNSLARALHQKDD